jgi:hypothetical protein
VVSANSLTAESGSVSDRSARKRIGDSAGLTFRKEGGLGMSGGNCRSAAEIAVCTSSAAPSMSRVSLNWMVTEVVPKALVEVIESMPAIVENCFSSGVATEDAMVSGLAPGRFALTEIVGKSMVGRSLTGSSRKASTPKISMPSMTSVVMTGRRMQSSGTLMGSARWRVSPSH